MASYKEQKRLMMKYSPSLYQRESQILSHLFFVNGNGYEWENGELVDFWHRSETQLGEERKRFLAWLKTLLAGTSLTRKQRGEILKTKVFPGRIKIYPLCEFAEIMNIPDDVKPDWLVAARKSLGVARDLKKTASDIRYLAKARKRIRELEQRR